MALVKIVRAGDAESGDRGTTFASRAYGSYHIDVDGARVGSIVRMHRYPLRKLNPACNGYDAVWVAYIGSTEIAANQYFAVVRDAVRTQLTQGDTKCA